MATATATGRIAQVIGSTFDADFDEGHLPDIYNALKVETEEKGVKIDLTGEVQQQLGGAESDQNADCKRWGRIDALLIKLFGCIGNVHNPNWAYFFFPAAVATRVARSCKASDTTWSMSSWGAGFPVQISNCRAAW